MALEPKTEYTITVDHRERLMDGADALNRVTTHDAFTSPEQAKAAVDDIIQLLIGVHNEME